jgi:hypothetical protein
MLYALKCPRWCSFSRVDDYSGVIVIAFPFKHFRSCFPRKQTGSQLEAVITFLCNRGSNPGACDLLFSETFQTGSGAHPDTYSMRTGVLFQG